jgi:hypothetical protein
MRKIFIIILSVGIVAFCHSQTVGKSVYIQDFNNKVITNLDSRGRITLYSQITNSVSCY